MKTAEEYYRAKNYLVGKQLTSQDLENIAIMESYAKERAVEFRLTAFPKSDRIYMRKQYDIWYDNFIKEQS